LLKFVNIIIVQFPEKSQLEIETIPTCQNYFKSNIEGDIGVSGACYLLKVNKHC
jgi:hypothetical protein